MIHFIGIKGAGMSSLAQIMYSLGYEVSGSDVEKEFFTEIGLREKNIPVFLYDANNIKEGMDIVLGNSITEDNVELIKAKELNLKISSYQEMIGELTKKFSTIAVSGCHGKTTTTAILSHVLDNAVGCNYLIGDGTGHADKNNKYFALEACEYKRHFLIYSHKYSIITNIELDHVDYYKSINDIFNAYEDFAKNTEKMVIAWGDDSYIRKLTPKNILYYGISDNNDIVAKNISYNKDNTKFDVYIKGEFYHHFKLPLFGEHLLLNTLAVITVCYLENIKPDIIEKHLLTFKGAKRRFNERIVKDTIIIDDYAHHPTEIKVTIDAARQKYPDKKIIAIFQPHTFTRTKKFMNEFIYVLNLADKSYLLDIHPAREKQEEYLDITSHIIVEKLKNGEYLDTLDISKLKSHENEVLVFMGANDLKYLEDEFIELIS